MLDENSLEAFYAKKIEQNLDRRPGTGVGI